MLRTIHSGTFSSRDSYIHLLTALFQSVLQVSAFQPAGDKFFKLPYVKGTVFLVKVPYNFQTHYCKFYMTINLQAFKRYSCTTTKLLPWLVHIILLFGHLFKNMQQFFFCLIKAKAQFNITYLINLYLSQQYNARRSFSIECCNIKKTLSALNNHNRCKQKDEPNRT